MQTDSEMMLAATGVRSMSKFYRIVYLVVPTLLTMHTPVGYAARPDCKPEMKVTFEVPALKRWGDLPSVLDQSLPEDLIQTIENHPRVRELRTTYRSGADVTFRMNERAVFGGWGIQRQFLTTLIERVLPKSRVVLGGPTAGVTMLRLSDSTMQDVVQPTHVDLSDLKILNRGPRNVGRTSLRAQLNLPADDFIASVYAGHTTKVTPAQAIGFLFGTAGPRLVILSSQEPQNPLFLPTEIAGIPVFTDSAWVKINPKSRPRTAVIFNETRERLPFIHAAADAVIVLGAANILEPIHAGRPTFFDRGAVQKEGHAGWRRLAEVAERSGRGRAFDDLATLRARLTEPRASSAPGLAAADERLALDRVLDSLVHALAAGP